MDLDTFRYMRNRDRRSQRSRLVARIRALDPGLAASVQNLNIPWFAIEPKKITNQSTEDTTEVYIYEEIDWFWGLSADVFVQELNEITTDNIDVRLNSPGGDVFDSIAIYNALVKHPANVTVYVDSLAASGASIIAMAGDTRIMMIGSQMMIHDAMGIELGNAAQLREYADFLDKQSDNIASIYAARAGGEPSDWRAAMIAETWLFAQEAVDMGLADSIYVKPDAAEESEEDPDKADEPDPEDPNEGEEGDEEEPIPMDPDEEEEAESVVDFLKVRHSVSNRGFKFPGRKKAKAPFPVPHNLGSISDEMLDKFIAKMRGSD